MIGAAWPLVRAAFAGLDAERAHELTLALLERAPIPPAPADDPRLAVAALGLTFSNPIGLAAGFDKDARVPGAMLRLGFGFVEVGTLTPRAQPGNPRPRVFRLAEDRGVINRLGFNNGGHAAALKRLARRPEGLLGINVGANKDSADKAADYVAGVAAFAPYADYLTVNISSPNTPGLRDLQAHDALDDLLARLVAARTTARRRPPLLVKIAPDLSLAELDDVVAVVLARDVDGLIVSNTTLARPPLSAAAAHEAGGLSGAPLFRRATWMLAEAALRVKGRLPLVGVGGIASGADAVAKLRAGASLIQLYSALTFAGPGLLGDIKRALVAAVAAEGVADLTSLVGREAEAVARAGPNG